MEILRSTNQIYDKIESLFATDDAKILSDNNFVFEIAKYELIKPLSEILIDKVFDKKDIDDLFSLVFQLNEYTPVVCNLVHLFLCANKYEEVFSLVNKIFVAHIGNFHYLSKKSTLFSERNFDRLAEIVKTANIKNEVFIPFLLEIYKCESVKIYSKWKNPALEYLQSFFVDNESWLINFVKENPDLRYKTYGAILDFNTTKGVEYLVKDFFNAETCDKDQNTSLLKNYMRDILYYVDVELPKVDSTKSTQLVEILLSMGSDNEVMARIQDIYSNTKDENIKLLISSKLGISETMNIRTEKQFLYSVKRKIKEPQERSLGLPFDKLHLKLASGNLASNAVYTFIIYLFKEEKNLNNLYKLNVLKNIFERESLQDFADQMFDNLYSKGDILQAKWCVRLYALLSNQSQTDKILETLTTLFNQNRNKEANYLLMCLIYSKKVEIIDFIKSQIEANNYFIKEHLEEIISTLSFCLSMHEEDIKDMLVPSEFSIGEFDIQRDRLYSAFIGGKMYEINLFKKLFLDNKIYNKLAQNLIFGEYRYGRLYNAFIIKNTDIEFVIGKTIFENDYEKDADILIGLVHPLDCDFKFEKLYHYFPSPTFNQFKPAKFNSADYSISSTIVNRFVGVVINTKTFLQYLIDKEFQPNKTETETEYKSLVHVMPAINIFCEVEFEKTIKENMPYNTISTISFYKLSDIMTAQGKYITKKPNALAISSVPYRYFDYVLNLVLEASKM